MAPSRLLPREGAGAERTRMVTNRESLVGRDLRPILYSRTQTFIDAWLKLPMPLKQQCRDALGEIIQMWQERGPDYVQWPKHLHPERLRHQHSGTSSVRLSGQPATRGIFFLSNNPAAIYGRQWNWIALVTDHRY